ncbi:MULTISPECIES: peptide chain release factor N(5)-glutamine methyltransferase [Thermomonospora]|uniref:Release factor glutamine methyltransferase n=1 Tax=Thermomonospora curvata (strain ATCC 19995 / DSM 43183 / JCM 3096 / KCTC 9072 / NBRC 15933 / NCIMB 10081 / Henssen B9) TaxID=471852 RepID=D1AE33_THECD|nr:MULTISPECIES: peptide chain release factor N(5)-glutamine methyltransferase [Thermomonospora]ACY99459.1 modification methylase, HemK family [Thermomonospora curvata DSM 43183]PKK12500.1 MAG: peptide chain release factor N(5)-glutamine methyltransferase [Thermomonospora sp. CIF 1]
MNLLLEEVARATVRLADAGVASPRADAEELAAAVHGVKRSELHTVPDSAFDARFWEGVARREAGEPLQHITGRAFFRYLELKVGPGVFIPRPETEVMVGWALETLHQMDVRDPLVVDLGTGSGAIALSIVQEAPSARVHAVEKDPTAFVYATRNVEELDLRGRVRLHLADFADALQELNGTVDLVISNPPYIPMSEWEYVPPEVRDHDPAAALWGGGDDGLDAIRTVERTARRLLRPGGHVAVEHSDMQGNAVYWVFAEEHGWRDVRNHRDLTDRDRFVTARLAVE